MHYVVSDGCMLCMLICCRVSLVSGLRGRLSPVQRACMRHQRMLQLRPGDARLLDVCSLKLMTCTPPCAHCAGRGL